MKKELFQKIYSHMGDNYSREMYGYRLLYSLTGANEWIEKVISMTDEGRTFMECLSQNASKEKIIFGTGSWANSLLRTFPDVRWNYFVDNHVKETVKFGIPVLAFDELCRDHKEAVIVVATRLYYREIISQLLENGFPEENIINMGKMIDDMSHRQYFDLPELMPEQDEVFVDVGCFDGTTSILFSEWSKGNYKHIFAFERKRGITTRLPLALLL